MIIAQDNGDHSESKVTWDKSDTEALEDATTSIIDDEGFSLEEFIVYVREKTRYRLFDEYHGIKTNPPEETFHNARMTENLVKVGNSFLFCVLREPTSSVVLFLEIFSESIHGRPLLRSH